PICQRRTSIAGANFKCGDHIGDCDPQSAQISLSRKGLPHGWARDLMRRDAQITSTGTKICYEANLVLPGIPTGGSPDRSVNQMGDRLVYESKKSKIFRRQDDRSGAVTAVKVLNYEFPTPADIAQFHNEFDIISGLKVPGIRG